MVFDGTYSHNKRSLLEGQQVLEMIMGIKIFRSVFEKRRSELGVKKWEFWDGLS